MPTQRRRFSVEQKMEILQQAKQSGITAVLRKHNLSYSVFHRWKEKMADKGKEESRFGYSHSSSRIRDLMEENSLLKKIIANQAMLLELKEEELKKRK
ncbi:MAG: transposase [Bacteroidetes bacterium]|nr:MAG: transposase [Bacteroidota bacterium]